jgi:arsenite methyltransferase
MENEKDLKRLVREKYAEIAGQTKNANESSCCGCGPSSTEVYTIMSDDYSQLKGYQQEADLGLGCGLPTEFAKIKPGNIVIDLGSGAGNDCFVARHETGPEGKVIGIDFTPEMIQKARENAEKLAFHNVEFREGDIESMPVNDEVADVVVSNCVLNLVPNKKAVMQEVYRILKPGGHFSISDIVLVGDLPEELRTQAEMYAGCVSGAIQMDEYLKIIQDSGFQNISIQKKKAIHIPDDILNRYLNTTQLMQFREQSTGIYSISVYAERPLGHKSFQKEKIALADLDSVKVSHCRPRSGCC